MGGTLFLDEVADTPVAVQDNFLTVLQEKQVSRRGWETIQEDVGNVVVIAATHKSLQQEVKRFRDSSDSERPVGFRPDLLTRLASAHIARNSILKIKQAVLCRLFSKARLTGSRRVLKAIE